MKRFNSLVLGALIAMAPMSASALEALTDSSMNDVTGQAGVSIAIDEVVLVQHIGESKYTDTDGTDGVNGASIVIGNKFAVKHINAILSATDTYAGNLDAANTFDYTGYFEKARALSIDVGVCSLLTEGNNNNKDALDAGKIALIEGVIGGADGDITTAGDNLDKDATAAALYAAGATDSISEARGLYEYATQATAWGDMNVAGVVIGLPTLEIHTSADSYDVGIESAGAINDGNKYIKIEKGASTLAILGGTLEIAAH
jgi:hypothetical protein